MKKLLTRGRIGVPFSLCIMLYFVAAAPTYDPTPWDPGMYKTLTVPSWHIPATDSVKAVFRAGLAEFYDNIEYIDSLMIGFHLAKLMEARYEIPWAIILAQWTVESGGKHHNGGYMPGKSVLARRANNHFGIKKGRRDGILTKGEFYSVISPEEKDGKQYHKLSKFAKFRTRFDGFSAHSLLLRSTYIDRTMIGNPWHTIPQFETDYAVNTSWNKNGKGEKDFRDMYRWETHIVALKGFSKKYATDSRYYAKIHTLAEKFYTAAGEMDRNHSVPVQITEEYRYQIVESLKDDMPGPTSSPDRGD